MAQKLGEHLGKQFYVENIAGATGNIGTGQAAKAAPDGAPNASDNRAQKRVLAGPGGQQRPLPVGEIDAAEISSGSSRYEEATSTVRVCRRGRHGCFRRKMG
jgi:hypothetical protein